MENSVMENWAHNPRLSGRSAMLGTMHRRLALFSLLAAPLAASAEGLPAGVQPLSFPADFGAHPGLRTEWWYLTGRLQAGDRRFGFQVTFFRSATGLADGHPSRFAAQQLVFTHA